MHRCPGFRKSGDQWLLDKDVFTLGRKGGTIQIAGLRRNGSLNVDVFKESIMSCN